MWCLDDRIAHEANVIGTLLICYDKENVHWVGWHSVVRQGLQGL